MSRAAHILGFALAVSCLPVLGQTICTPRLGAGYDCYDYDQGTYIDIRPRLGVGTYHYPGYGELTHQRGYSPNNYGTGNFGDITPRLDAGYNTYNYSTGEQGIITPRLGGGFIVDRY
jgi:hypothetical protein